MAGVLFSVMCAGSPPRRRGKGTKEQQTQINSRITPA